MSMFLIKHMIILLLSSNLLYILYRFKSQSISYKIFRQDIPRRFLCEAKIQRTQNTETLCRAAKLFRQDQLGSASCTSFYLFFSGTFLFTMAGTLLSTGVWCFLVRLPMIHMAPGPSRIIVVLSGYIFAAGALTLPASCILYREHNVTRDRRTLLPVRLFAIITNHTMIAQRSDVIKRK